MEFLRDTVGKPGGRYRSNQAGICLGGAQSPAFLVADLGSIASEPAGGVFHVGGAAGKQGLQVALLVADISAGTHSISAYQGRQ